jgi:P27 family predicted phage terminase small subunit
MVGKRRERGLNAPEDLDQDGRDRWFAGQRQLREQSTWRDTDSSLLAAFVRSVRTAAVARAQLAEEGITTTTRDGRPAAHPCVKIAREAEADARAAAADLLLTPASRRRAGVGEPKTLEDELSTLIA